MHCLCYTHFSGYMPCILFESFNVFLSFLAGRLVLGLSVVRRVVMAENTEMLGVWHSKLMENGFPALLRNAQRINQSHCRYALKNLVSWTGGRVLGQRFVAVVYFVCLLDQFISGANVQFRLEHRSGSRFPSTNFCRTKSSKSSILMYTLQLKRFRTFL